MQWKNLRPLITEGLATDRDSLIIGDEKQCIYRFRSSDPTLLQHQLKDQFGDNASVHGDNPEENTNWRSSATVVEFNNRFFSIASDINSVADIYANVAQEISSAHRDHKGYVSFVKAEGNAAEAASEGYRRMADEIARQIASGYKPADIAILGRNSAHMAGAITYLLNRQESDPDYPRFRIISDDSIEIGRSRSVRLVISVLRSLLLSRPGDYAAAETGERRRSNHTLEDIVLARLVNDYEHGCARGLDPSSALEAAVAASRLSAAADGQDPGQRSDSAGSIDTGMVCPNLQTLVDRIIAAFIDPAAMEAENIYITALQDLVASFAMRGGADLREFLQWWDSRGSHSPVASPQADDSLRVMTIHKSKGLEFKCVHIPVADWTIIRFSDTEWFEVTGDIADIDASLLPPLIPLVPNKDLVSTPFGAQYQRREKEALLDETNTLYVAFTRAVDELIVTYGTTPGYSGTLIAGVLKEMGSADGNFSDGDPVVPAASRQSPKTAIEPSGTIALNAHIPVDRASLWADTRLDLPVDPLSPRGRGIMLHDVLAHIGDRSDLPRAVKRMVSRGVVPRALAGEVSDILARELDRPEVRPWFSGFRRYMTERPIAIGESGTEHRRPDRVVWTADGHTDVIDYKSGEERPGSHRRQVAFYMSQLRRLGHKRVRGFIWYIDSGEIVTVSSS